MASGVLRSHLAKICDAEGVAADPAALALVARGAEGSVRDALSLLGQLVASAEDEGITYESAVELIGVTDARVLNLVVGAIADADAATLFDIVDQVIESGSEPRRFATDILDRLRDILVMQAMPDAAERGVIDAPEEQLGDIAAAAERLGRAELTRAADLVNDGLSSLRGATAPRLTLEILCARLVLPQAGGDDLDLLARIDRLERRSAELAAVAPAAAAAPVHPDPPVPEPARPVVTAQPAVEAHEDTPTPAPRARVGGSRRLSDIAPVPKTEPAPAPTEPRAADVAGAAADSTAGAPPSTTPTPSAPGAPAPATGQAPAGTITLEQVRNLWPAVIDAVKARSRVAWMTVSQSVPLSATDRTVVAAVADAGAVAHFSRTAYPDIVREAMREVLKTELGFDLVVDPSKAPAKGAKNAPSRSARSQGEATDGSAPATQPATEEEDVRDSEDAATPLTGIALIEAELGGKKIDEFEA